MPYLHIVYHSTPFSFQPPPLPLHGEEKVETPIIEGGSKLVVPEKLRAPPRRWEWKPRKAVGGAAASPMIEEVSYSSRTTVMVKNIPNQIRRDFMMEFLDSYCNAHSLEYDFMYLPMDFRSKDNLGYAFVNFTNGRNASEFRKIVHGYKWGTIETAKGFYNSKKICAITWARIQGKEKLVKRFENSIFGCDDPDFLPVVFHPPRGGSNTTSPVVVGMTM
ncbi:protein terminal ear1 homolog [Salvia miltiorrhiza]|uniref:protein terminal ear1 homolog n=1 Tax=Salvia miltiorrhiza TaxID=226208 RepID=UPI0025ACF6B1|nr:protein terminal ear1 homolog [Salvia miltiorrhiza]